MSYRDDIESKNVQNIGYYIEFDGIEKKLSTRNFGASYISCIADNSISTISNKLDRELSFIEPSGLTLSVLDSEEIRLLLRRRGGAEDIIDSDLGIFDTFLSTSNTSFSTSDIIYINKETLYVNSSHTGSGYNIIRAYHGSKQVAHRQGSIFSDVPRHWLNRVCRFYAVDVESGNSHQLGSYFLSSSPKFKDGLWSIECADLLSRLNTPIYKGWKSQDSIDVEEETEITGSGVNPSNIVKITVDDARNFQLNSNNRADLKVSFGDYWGIFKLFTGSIDYTDNTVKVAFSHVSSSNFGETSLSSLKRNLIDSKECEIQLIYVYSGSMNQLVLQLMMSRIGDSLNGSYDVLAGVDEAYNSGRIDEGEKRLGAGIDQGLIDVSSFSEGISNDNISIIIDSEQRIIDFLAKEILWRSGGYIHVNSLGEIAFKKYTPITIRSKAKTVNESTFLDYTVSSVDDENTRIARALVKCNYHPEDGFKRDIEIVFSDDAAIFGDNRAELSLESKGVWIGGLSTGIKHVAVTSFLKIQLHMERLKQRQALSGHRPALRFPWSQHLNLTIGERILLSDSRLPSHVDSDSLSDSYFEIVGTALDPENGEFTADIESIPQGVLIGCSFEVQSYNVGSNEITINNSGDLGDGVLHDSNPADDVAEDWLCRIYRAAASPPYSTYEDNIIYAAATTFLELRNTPTINPAAGDIITIIDSDDSGNLNDVGADVQDFAYGANSSYQVGSGSYLRNSSRWG